MNEYVDCPSDKYNAMIGKIADRVGVTSMKYLQLGDISWRREVSRKENSVSTAGMGAGKCGA